MVEQAQVQDDMPKAYEPGKVEQKWYRFWLKKGYFTSKIDHEKEPFVIVMPPPNITGELHIGHALTATLEDIMIRWHRMRGDPTLWLPGIDHAGIAAQVVVEQQMAEEGQDRHKLGRDRFLERMWQWAQKCRQTIAGQHQRLGVSCDWSREMFTLDDGPSRAVRTAFVRLYEKELIYRGERIINWCPRCATAISDLEVNHRDISGNLYYARYRLAEDSQQFITVATTRPETILGDTAVAVSPDDRRFKALVGKRVILPAVYREIPIIADEAVDPEFGTGAVKITPAHDPVDFDVAQRHGLPLINILNLDATMNENAGPYTGLNRYACRKAILTDLEKDGVLVKIEPYRHSVGHCDRCQTIIEPIVSKQWFIKMSSLAKPALDAVMDGSIRIVPERFNKVYFNWLENIRDWCISRQLWWGHRIPVWYCAICGELTVMVDEPPKCLHCGSDEIRQDPDVLDTWFSSALWPHSILGWPEDTEELSYFYPTTVMETGYDILFFWVARMIMMGLEDTGSIPFHTVYLHGLIRDEKGEKMSKVRGNVLNPLATLEKYGTDALRFALSTGTSPGNDIKLSKTRLEAGRNFANKLWNTTRFVIRSINGGAELKIQPNMLPVEDRWILSRLSRVVARVTDLMEKFQFGEAQRQIYEFIWGEFCDWYIEIAKVRLQSDKEALSPAPVLTHVLETSLRLLHPYMPFVTEELWQNLRRHLAQDWQFESIMVAPYPKALESYIDSSSEIKIDSVIEIIRSIRNTRREFGVESDKWIPAQIDAGDLLSAISAQAQAIKALARVDPLYFSGTKEKGPLWGDGKTLGLVLQRGIGVSIPLKGMIDITAERERLQKEVEQARTDVARIEGRLNDSAFRSKAPKAVIEKEQNRLAERRDRLERMIKQIITLEA